MYVHTYTHTHTQTHTHYTHTQVMGGKRQALGDMDFGAGGYTLKVLVANKSAGSVIGKAGATINAIKEQSGARVKVYRVYVFMFIFVSLKYRACVCVCVYFCFYFIFIFILFCKEQSWDTCQDISCVFVCVYFLFYFLFFVFIFFVSLLWGCLSIYFDLVL